MICQRCQSALDEIMLMYLSSGSYPGHSTKVKHQNTPQSIYESADRGCRICLVLLKHMTAEGPCLQFWDEFQQDPQTGSLRYTGTKDCIAHSDSFTSINTMMHRIIFLFNVFQEDKWLIPLCELWRFDAQGIILPSKNKYNDLF
jgi:hypothetical protein